MDNLFPSGLPWPTAFYLTVYLMTFAMHQAFMHYVLAGSLYVTWVTIRPGRETVPLTEQPLAATLRDWMPFLLSAAITAGVAPLLFIQIVYQHSFYTANLLLWWRWMALVPVLIIAFYLLYLIKSRTLWKWPYFVRVMVVAGASASFVFTGFCWTVNHLLANRSEAWPEVYVTGQLPFSSMAVVLRMLVWIGGSFATMSVIAGWQLWYRHATHREAIEPVNSRPLAGMALGGLGLAWLAGVAYIMQADEMTRNMVFGRAIFAYIVVAVIGAIVQVVGWGFQWRSSQLQTTGLVTATTGAVVSLSGVCVIREGIRISAIDLTGLSVRHSEAATVGGFGLFVVAAVVVSLLIGWCVWLVRAGASP